MIKSSINLISIIHLELQFILSLEFVTDSFLIETILFFYLDKDCIKNDEKNNENDTTNTLETSCPSPTDSNQLNQEDSNKVFTVNDIQTLMNNQSLHKSQLDQNLDQTNKLDQQQYLILVKQNGDKIILIQNPSVADNQLQINSTSSSNLNVDPIEEINHTIDTVISNQDKELSLNSSQAETDEFLLSNNQENLDDNEIDPELSRIQLQHKQRQKSLMLQLERLKEKHRQKEFADNNEEEKSTEDDTWEFNIDETNEYEKQRSNHKTKQYAKKKSIPIEKFCCEAKWFPSFCNDLEKAHNYVKRRSENVEQLSKYFPIASYAFESRCAELKKHLKKLELNLERFQNVLGKDLHFVENKLKNFFQDYHLEQFSAVIEDEDEKDLKQSLDNHLMFNNSYGSSNLSNNRSMISNNQNKSQHLLNSNSHKNNSKNSSVFASSSKLELITPMSISITPTEQQQDEIDPVLEIRDVRCDASLEELGKYYSNNVNLKKSTTTPVSIRTKRVNRKSKDESDFRNKHQKKSSS